MQYLTVRNLEKYHPGYKDRTLQWAKIFFKLVQGDPEFELVVNETDKWRYITFIILQLHIQKPIPLDPVYLTRKGFDLKKRNIDATIQALHNFVDTVTKPLRIRNVDKEEDKEEDKEKEGVTDLSVPGFKSQDLISKFERIWLRYPRREGKAQAFKHFKATVKTEENWLSIKVALENYKDHLQKEKTDVKFIKQGSTWFNQWGDWQTDPTAPNEHTKHLCVLQKSND